MKARTFLNIGFSALLMTMSGSLGVVHATEYKVTSAMLQLWEKQYESLDAQIAGFKDGTDERIDPAKMADPEALIFESDNSPIDVILRRTRVLIQDIEKMEGSPDLSELSAELSELEISASSVGETNEDKMNFYNKVALVRRKAAFSNPLFSFDSLLVFETAFGMKGRIQTTVFGFRNQNALPAMEWGNEVEEFRNFDYDTPIPCPETGKCKPGRSSGPIILSNLKSGQPTVTTILRDAIVEEGRLKGRKIHRGGSFGPHGDLDFDAERIVFSFSDTGYPAPHIFSANIDGTDLRQLTDGAHMECNPVWLPNDRIVFSSSLLGVSNRCGGDLQHPSVSVTLASIKSDGSDLFPISWHETTEFYPVVDNDGMLVYMRWDYVDRDFNAGHHMWTCYPDGRDPRSYHGNYPLPHWGTMDRDGRMDRLDWANVHTRPIPNTSKVYVSIAARHHEGQIGIPLLIDTRIPDDSKASQVTRLINSCFPNEVGGGESGSCKPRDQYATPWPLSDGYFIISKRVQFNKGRSMLVLLDKFGNEVFIEYTKAWTPIPIMKRTKPPIIPERTWQGERTGLPDHKRATIGVVNVMESDFDWPEGTSIKKLRVLAIVAKPWIAPRGDTPELGLARNLPRHPLGTVPVEEDGSAYFEAPVGTSIMFQALDSLDRAVQGMRSGTYVHPGEQLVCTGCHEDKWKSTPSSGKPLAFQRAPSKLEPGPEGSLPITYARIVRPIIKNSCLPCHHANDTVKNIPLDSENDYAAWAKRGFWFHDGFSGGKGRGEWRQRGLSGYRSEPGNIGFLGSEYGELFTTTHKDRISEKEMKRLITWVDCNTMEYGAHYDLEKQDAGEVVWPVNWFDPDNPTGVEIDRPSPLQGDITELGRRQEIETMQVGRLPIVKRSGGELILHNPSEYSITATIFDLQGRLTSKKVLQAGKTGRTTLGASGSYIVKINGPMIHATRRIGYLGD